MNEMIIKNNELTLEKLEQYEESFIDYLDVDDKTLRIYKVGIENFINYLKENNIKKPTRNDLIDYRNMLRDNYSSCTTNTYMTSIKALFKYLEIHNLYENIAKDIKGAKYSTTPKKEVLDVNKVKEIYNNLDNLRDKTLFSLFITTGLRAIEVSRAKIEDIKEHNGEIVLWIQCKKHDGKDEYVKLSNQVLKDLKEYIGNRKSGYIFVSTSNVNLGSGMTTTSIRRIIKNIFRNFGIDKDTISCHSLRRTFATISYENGSSIYDIQSVLHHSNISTTTRYLQAVNRDKNKTEYNVSNVLFN